jgi:hypothetical protein
MLNPLCTGPGARGEVTRIEEVDESQPPPVITTPRTEPIYNRVRSHTLSPKAKLPGSKSFTQLTDAVSRRVALRCFPPTPAVPVLALADSGGRTFHSPHADMQPTAPPHLCEAMKCVCTDARPPGATRRRRRWRRTGSSST